jgi:hypothetical protein
MALARLEIFLMFQSTKPDHRFQKKGIFQPHGTGRPENKPFEIPPSSTDNTPVPARW